jgi:hypothetical protein
VTTSEIRTEDIMGTIRDKITADLDTRELRGCAPRTFKRRFGGGGLSRLCG